MKMENGFSSPGAEAFPAGLRVLVVEDDPTWLKILEKMLKKCLYEVTTCGLARDALNLLRERKDGFDIVISDVNMPDMDGFKLLEHVGLEMDLPVIMMSVDGETSRVMKGVQHGACDYLLKPIRMKELKNIWQHVLRKRIHEVRDAEFNEGIESIQMTRTGSDLSDDAYFLFGEDVTSPKKRKDTEIKHDEKESSDVSSAKKARVVWSVDLHQKFVKAVDQIGYDKVGPKKILDLMNVPWLTRENVASHLQKYRLYLSRLQNESDQKPGDGAVKLSDMSPLDSTGNFGFQDQIINVLHEDATKGSFEYSGSGQVVQNMGRRSLDSDRKAMHVAEPRGALGSDVPNATKGSFEYSSSSQVMVHRSLDSDQKASIQMHVTEPRRALGIDVPNPRKPRRSCASVECSVAFTPPKLEASYASDSNFGAQYSWCDIASFQPKQENKPSFADGNLSQFQLNGQWQHLPADSVQPAPSISPSIPKTAPETGGCLKIRSSDEYGPNANLISSVWSSDNLRPLETITSVPDRQAIVSVPDYQAVVPSLPDQFQLSMKNQGFNWDCIPEYGSVQKHVNLGVQAYTNLDESVPFCLVKGDCFSTNLVVQNLQFPDSCHSGIFGEVHLLDGLDTDSLYDPAECSLFDQGLFIV